MMWIKIAAIAIILLVFLRGALRANIYRKIFSNQHFIELARGLFSLKEAALSNISSQDVLEPNDSRILRTKYGLIVTYIIYKSGEQYIHHYSVAMRTGHTPLAVGKAFVSCIAILLGIDTRMIKGNITRTNEFHAVFALDESAQEEFAKRNVPVLENNDVRPLIRECALLKDEIPYETPPPQP